MTVVIACATCGKSMTRPIFATKRSKTLFCSVACRAVYQGKHPYSGMFKKYEGEINWDAKECVTCKRVLPFENFRGRSASIDNKSNECKECDVVRKKQYDKRNPQKIKARRQIMNHVNRGIIERPSYCSACLNEGKPEAHHPDYSKPLDVIWLCRRCHLDVHSPRKRQRKILIMETLK